MTRRFLAALTALSLCLWAASCGKAANEDSAESGSSSVAEDAHDVSEYSDNDGDSSDEAAEGTAGDFSDMAFELSPENIAVYTFEDINDMPTNEEAIMYISLVLEQYQAAFEGDAQKFLDLICLDNFAIICEDLIAEEQETEIDEDSPKGDMLIAALYIVSWLYGDELASHEEYSREETVDAMHELIKSAEYQDEEMAKALGETYYATIPTFGSLDYVGSDTVVWMEVSGFAREGEDTYISFSLGVPAKDDGKCYVIENSLGWYIDGNWGIFIGKINSKNDPYEGMTAEEIRNNPIDSSKKHFTTEDSYPEYEEPDSDEDELSPEETELLDKAYNGLLSAFWVYTDSIANYYNAGDDVEKMISKDFVKAYSEEGLDLSDGEPSAEGDQYLYQSMKIYGCTEGIVKISKYDPNRDYPTVYYTSPNGTTIEY